MRTSDHPRLPRGHHPRDDPRDLLGGRHPGEVGDFSLTEIYTADEVFVTGTMGGVTPVLTVDGRTIGAGRPGPYVAKLAAAYAARTAVRGDAGRLTAWL